MTMSLWEVKFRTVWEHSRDVTPSLMVINADGVSCEDGVAFFYALSAAPYKNRTVAAVPLDVVLAIREAG